MLDVLYLGDCSRESGFYSHWNLAHELSRGTHRTIPASQRQNTVLKPDSPDTISTQKTAQLIVENGNHYLGALKGNQSNLLKTVKAYLLPNRIIPISVKAMDGLRNG